MSDPANFGGGPEPAPPLATPATPFQSAAAGYSHFLDPSREGTLGGLIGGFMGSPSLSQVQGKARGIALASLQKDMASGTPPPQALNNFFNSPEGLDYFANTDAATQSADIAEMMKINAPTPMSPGETMRNANGTLGPTAPTTPGALFNQMEPLANPQGDAKLRATLALMAMQGQLGPAGGNLDAAERNWNILIQAGKATEEQKARALATGATIIRPVLDPTGQYPIAYDMIDTTSYRGNRITLDQAPAGPGVDANGVAIPAAQGAPGAPAAPAGSAAAPAAQNAPAATPAPAINLPAPKVPPEAYKTPGSGYLGADRVSGPASADIVRGAGVTPAIANLVTGATAQLFPEFGVTTDTSRIDALKNIQTAANDLAEHGNVKSDNVAYRALLNWGPTTSSIQTAQMLIDYRTMLEDQAGTLQQQINSGSVDKTTKANLQDRYGSIYRALGQVPPTPELKTIIPILQQEPGPIVSGVKAALGASEQLKHDTELLRGAQNFKTMEELSVAVKNPKVTLDPVTVQVDGKPVETFTDQADYAKNRTKLKSGDVFFMDGQWRREH